APSSLLVDRHAGPPCPHSSPTRRSSDLLAQLATGAGGVFTRRGGLGLVDPESSEARDRVPVGIHIGRRHLLRQPLLDLEAHHVRSEEHTSELQSRENLVCRLLLEKKNIS